MPSADIVFLLPGFLGFERAGNFGNFADRVCGALRTQLEARLQKPVLVIPLGSLETTTFAARQRGLLESLTRHVLAQPEIERIHLVGHSVGGVDAYLLSCRDALGGGVWSKLDPHGVRARIRSVTSIATPHGGTCLAAAPGAGSLTLRAVVQDPTGALAMVQLVNKMFASAFHDVGPHPSAGSVFREGRKVKHFMAELMRWQGFLHALTPDAMESLYATVTPLPDISRKSFVTMAGRPKNGERAADGFFEELSRRTAGNGNGFTRHGTRVRDAISSLRTAFEDESRLIMSAATLLPAHVDAQTNDGVVNSVRQLITPTDASELAGLVVADHFDVLGYYDRGLSVADSDPRESTAQVSGILHSGSCFRDTEFFALYRKVADTIVDGSAEIQAASEPEPVLEKPARSAKRSRTPSRRPTA
jgi:pimeloyl-ACP methyl ester carboxylesterase